MNRASRKYEQKIIDVSRVVRVVAGGRRFRFRVALLIGDKKGRVGFGIAKGGNVQSAIEKAYQQAEKNLLDFSQKLFHTVLYEMEESYKTAKIFMKPAREGTGLIAGGTVRSVLEMAGFRNVVAKILGSKNKMLNTIAVLNALKKMETKEEVEARRSVQLEKTTKENS